jgi:hypothetical protein
MIVLSREAFMSHGVASRRSFHSLLFVAAGFVLLADLPTRAIADERGPTVVELFTSQGCSSCPPANANLAILSARPDILALSFGVTYWDRLGWKDTFARPDYTARQETYETPLGEAGPFTPQIVIDGRKSLVGNDLSELERHVAALRGARGASAPSIALGNGVAEIGAGAAPRDNADVWLVRYDPRRVEVPVQRGENAGRTLPHKNVVHDLLLLGRWTGRPMTAAIPPAREGLRSAVLVQAHGGGPIFAAATD